MDLEADSPERLLIEQRYGKRYVLRLVAKYEEDSANAEWFKSYTTVCPGCQVNVQKSFGCNHVGGSTDQVCTKLIIYYTVDMLKVWPTFLLPLWGPNYG